MRRVDVICSSLFVPFYRCSFCVVYLVTLLVLFLLLSFFCFSKRTALPALAG